MHVQIRLVIGCGALFLAWETTSLSGQAVRDAEVVALEHFRNLKGTVKLDPRVAFPPGGERGEIGRTREERRTRELADVVGADVAPLSDVLACPPYVPGRLRWNECQLQDAEHYLAVSDALSTPEGASVRILIYWSTGNPETPVAASVWLMQLKRRGAGWVIASAQAVATT